MTAITRLCMMYCAALPIQRYAAAGGAIVALISLALAVVSPPLAAAGVALGVTVAVTTWLLSLGFLFRLIASPRRYRFAPAFRVRTLAAAIALVALPSLLTAAVVLIIPVPAPVMPAIVYPALVTSGIVWWCFFVPASLWAAIALLPLLSLARSSSPERIDAFMSGPGIALGALIVIAGWTLFAAWYLRARRIGPFPAFPRILSSRRRVAQPSGAAGFDGVIRLLVWQRPLPRSGFHAIGAGVLLAAVLALLGDKGATTPSIIAAMLVGGIAAFMPGRQAVHRARLLWLTSGRSRMELLRAVERGLLRLCAEIGVVFAVTFGGALAYFGMPLAMLVPLLLVANTTALLAAYVGLASTGSARALDFALRMLLVASTAYAAWTVVTAPSAAGLLLCIAAAQAVTGLAARAAAHRRWRRLDWLEARPASKPANDPWSNLTAASG